MNRILLTIYTGSYFMLKCFFASLIAILFVLNAAAQQQAINWQKDYQTALALSRETGKPLLLDFTAKWCAPCQAMEKDFWTRADVAEAMKRFVAVKVDYDAEKSLVNRFAVRGLPYIAFSDPIGYLIFSRNRFDENGAEQLKQISESMPKDFSPLNTAYKAFDANDRDGLALLEIADFYAKAKMPAVSNTLYKRALPTAQIQADANKKEQVTARLGANAFNVKDYEQACEFAEDYLKNFPAGKNREYSYFILTVGNAKLDNLKDAESYLERFKAEFPKSKNLAEASQAVSEAKNKKSGN